MALNNYSFFIKTLSEELKNERMLLSDFVNKIFSHDPSFSIYMHYKTQKFFYNHKDSNLLDIYRNNADWTIVMNRFFIPYIIYKMGFTPQNEYYRIDTIGYKNIKKSNLIDEGKKLGLTPYGWDMGIAVEHENVKGEWIDEAIKLANINCPLRIIIGYNRPLKPGENNKQFEITCLNYFFKCLTATEEQLGKVYDESPMLILFGQRDDKNGWTKINYNAYELNLRNKHYTTVNQ